MYDLTLTIKDVLARESFKSAKVVAGENGLHRQVKWVHILEIKDSLEVFVNGDELILTTGIGLGMDLSTRLKFIKRLIKIGAACLCIERGPYFEKIPSEIIDLANDYQFPIILFENVVRFVEITQDLHTLIINHHHEMLSKLDALSQQFHSLSLLPNGILKILQELQHTFQQNVLFISTDTKSYYYPSEFKYFETLIQSYLITNPLQGDEKYLTISNHTFALMPVRGLGQIWGHVCLEIEQPLSDEFTFLILDRAALAIAQILLRNRTAEERKLNNEDELVRNLLNGQIISQEVSQSLFPATGRDTKFKVYVIEINVSEAMIEEYGWEEIKLQLSMSIRSIFKRNGLTLAISVNKFEMVVIALFPSKIQNEKERFLQITNQIKSVHHKFITGHSFLFGISKTYEELTMIEEGYKEAQLVLQMQRAAITDSFFFKDIGIYRILLQLKDNDLLQSFIQDYLQDLLDYDQEMGSDLFETLRVYLACNGSKKETAEQLFIVRQTLYHRIEKIESILGKDFMSPLNRITLEVAIRAHQLLNQSINPIKKI